MNIRNSSKLLILVINLSSAAALSTMKRTDYEEFVNVLLSMIGRTHLHVLIHRLRLTSIVQMFVCGELWL